MKRNILLFLLLALCQISLADESGFYKIGNNPVIKLDELWGYWDSFKSSSDAEGWRITGDSSHIRFDLRSELYSSNHQFIIRFYRADSFYLGGITIKGVCGVNGDCSFPGKWKNGKYEIGGEIAKFYTLELGNDDDHGSLRCETYEYQVMTVGDGFSLCYGKEAVWLRVLDSVKYRYLAEPDEDVVIPVNKYTYPVEKKCGRVFKDSLGTIPYNPFEERIEELEAFRRTSKNQKETKKLDKQIESLKVISKEWATCYPSVLACRAGSYKENDSTCSPLPEHAMPNKNSTGFDCEPGFHKSYKTGTAELICVKNTGVQVPKGSWKVDGGYISAASGVLVCDRDAGYWRATKVGTGEPYCLYKGY